MQMVTNVCKSCPLRLYNTKHYNFNGCGNKYSGNAIIVPDVDYNAYQRNNFGLGAHVNIIENILIPLTGEVDYNFYILPLIRCCTMNEPITDTILSNCSKLFAKDYHNFSDIMFCGTSIKFVGNYEVKNLIGTALLLSSGKRIYFNYSPLVKYKDADKFEIFKEQLKRYYNCVTYKDGSQFKWIRYDK